ncbi:MAG: class 1 fructose-bisphosphatase [Polyangiaceae bacterium]
MTESASSFPVPNVVGTTLEAHLTAGTRGAQGATGEFASLLNAISLAVRIIHTRVRAAGLAGMLGYTGEVNVQGEEVQKLDALANEILIAVLEKSGRCAMIASEELEEARVFSNRGKYIVAFDPLDGSSNIDVNISIGTIFCVLRAPESGAPVVEGALVPGTKIVAAGYSVYGSATTLILSTGQGVHGFTLDPTVGEFFLLLKGGIFAYPSDKKSPGGKLRLLYEANPMAYLFEQAGGMATNGVDRILDIVPKGLHDRTPLVLGSKHEVGVYRQFMKGER